MNKGVIYSLVVASLVTGLEAGGDILPVALENEMVEVAIEPVAPIIVEQTIAEPKEVKPVIVVEPKKVEVKEEKSHNGFYAVAKGLYILGDEHQGVDADSGKGFGLDLGYRFNKNLAVELDGTYSKNSDKTTNDDIKYTTGAVSLVYTLHATESLGLFAKAGYMREKESVTGGESNSESGIAYGGGLEYELSHNTALVAEYETSNIDSTRGNAISLGLMYNF